MGYIRENIDFEDIKLALHIWIPENNETNGLIQIIHGAAEHMKRYKEFAEYFNERGFIVFGIDHPGHGETAKLNETELGFFGKEKGWIKVVNSNKYIAKLIKERYKDKKMFLMGHSMGSIISRYYLIGDIITDGIILTGVMNDREVLTEIMKLIAKLEKGLNSDNSENVINNYLQDLIYNWKFDRTLKNSWISSLREEVVKYNEDDSCGFKYPNQMFIDLLQGLKEIEKLEKNKQIANDVPVFIISGSDDPVSDYGKDAKKLFDRYKENKLKDLKYKIYNGLRHEVIRDVRKEDVYKDLENWIIEHN